MKILLVHNRYRSGTPGGEDAVFEQERHLLESAGVEVLTYTRSNDEMDARRVVDAARVMVGLYRSRRTRRELRLLLRRERPDVAHFHNTVPLISGSAYLACREFRVPIVQTVHNFGIVCTARTYFRDGAVCGSCAPGSYSAAIRHKCYRSSALASAAVAGMLWMNHLTDIHCRFVDRFIALSPFVVSWLETIGIARDRIVLKPNFVQAAATSGVTQRGEYAIFAGRLAPEKGVDVLLDAWRDLSNIPLLVFGDGPQMSRSVNFAKERGLNVQFMGARSRSEVIEAMSRARMLVMPSGCYEAAIPLVVLEAWSVGTPVITSRLGSSTGIRENVEALQFAPGSAQELAAKVRLLWSDSGLAANLAVNGEARFKKENAEAVSLTQLMSIYGSLTDPLVAERA